MKCNRLDEEFKDKLEWSWNLVGETKHKQIYMLFLCVFFLFVFTISAVLYLPPRPPPECIFRLVLPSG